MRAAPAIQTDAADHTGGEYGKDHVLPLTGKHRRHSAGQHKPGQCGESASDRKYAPDKTVDRNACRARGLRVASDRVERATPSGAAKKPGACSFKDSREPHRCGNAEPGGVA